MEVLNNPEQPIDQQMHPPEKESAWQWLKPYLENPWIRLIAFVLAVSMLTGLIGHGVYLMIQNHAIAKAEKEWAQQQQVLQEKTDNYNEALSAAGQDTEKGDYQSALGHLDDCLDLVDVQSAQYQALITTRASLNLLQGNHQKALEDLEEILKKDPENPDVLLMKAQAEMECRDADAAIEDLKAYLVQCPGNADALGTLGMLYEQKQDYETAADYYRQLSEALPTDPDVKLNAARSLILSGDQTQASELLAPFLTDEDDKPHQAGAWFLQAMSQMQTGDYIGAADGFTQALNIGYDPYACLEQLIACSIVLEKFDQALAYGLQYAQLDPEAVMPAHIVQQLGIAAMSLSSYQEAVDMLSLALQDNPDYPGSTYYRGLCYMALEDWQPAADDFTAALEEGYLPQNSYYNRGLCHAQLQEYDEALNDMDAALTAGEESEIITAAEELIPALKDALEKDKL